ncbi:zona pellucida glycoprotein 3f, tandem duplicate 2 isoform X1 [Amphiprion ocellaris]|uniref:ZP domain-containing protein n=1 Tax=Amphiprion ocellaris TaxID=80972 RepID=A0AAQ5Y5J7_AMPOC|nr:zona pellucida glycoprotein 3f, tandem duplicate 2 isoform X1 [Amphiprion ocellaris]
MVTHLYLGVILLAGFAATVANADIKVDCGKDSVSVTWRINPEMVPYASRLFLGSCMPSNLHVLPTGQGEVTFHYQYNECKMKKLLKGKHIIYQTEMSYRPQAKPKPAAFVQPIKCVIKRPGDWVPHFLNPGSGLSEGRSGLVFHMALLNEQMTGIAKTNIITLGSFMPIWAAVEQKSHQPLLLLMEECVAATTAELQYGSQVYPLISNKGCLLESVRGNSKFLPRYHTSAIILYLQSFKFGLGEEVYIHCKLVAWDPESLDESKKTCHFVKETESWELLDDPLQSSLCSCCESTCKSRAKRGVHWASGSLSHNSVVGPLIIVERPDLKANSTSVGSASAADVQMKSSVQADGDSGPVAD